MLKKPNAALLILGHGSTENPDSSQPTWEISDAIREMNCFSSVHCAFWKEEPSFRQIFAAIEEKEIYVVPNFISEGYFTRQVLPRELEISGPTTVTAEGKTIHYCDPVGIHPSMTDLLAKRALELLGEAPSLDETALIIVGHGTGLNKKSTDAIKDQVTRLRESGHEFGEIIDAYMEEAPFISDWRTLTQCPTVVVVPFFIADGLHSFQDIPVMLGIVAEPTAAASQLSSFPENPHNFGNRQLFYSRAIGTEPSMAQVILDQVKHFDDHIQNEAA
ncbi:MAG: CbiX/SirB N-terminal domain-containing protein [Verrucomicrobiales bacterium]|nr:CbiX/SirB N-terminal domain-containing protein [Verrucomicrobiales bacterium]